MPRRRSVNATSPSPGSVVERSLLQPIVARLAICTCLVAMLAASTAFIFSARGAEEQSLADLRSYVEERGRSESALFARAQQNLQTFRAHFLKSYADPGVLPAADFDAYFVAPGDGTLRLRPRYFTGARDQYGVVRSGTSALVSRRRPPLTAELRRRLVLSYMLVSEFGPAWTGNFANLHVTLPENALIIHWPSVPWGLDAAPDLDLAAGSVIRSTLQAENPQRSAVWTGLYFDETASEWTVTYQLPVDLNGRHLVTPSLDIPLGDLIQRISNDRQDGGYSVILARDGTVIAHPAQPGQEQERLGQISVAEFGDPDLESIYATLIAASQGPQAQVVHDARAEAWLGFVELDGPGWWLVTVRPTETITGSAWRSARWLLLLIGATACALALALLMVLRSSVGAPIRQMTQASERLAAGDFEGVANGRIPLPEGRPDEIGLLARSFRSMARRIGEANRNMERAVFERTGELQRANRKLLELSLRDSLTGTFNRRAFDQDLTSTLETARDGETAPALILADIDHFKLFNDNYGHEAGDGALQQVAAQIRRSAGDATVYRYGGEEFAIIVPGELGSSADEMARAIVRDVAALGLPHAFSPRGTITLSAGVGRVGPNGTPPQLLRSADAALYAAKQSGRNAVSSSGTTD